MDVFSSRVLKISVAKRKQEVNQNSQWIFFPYRSHWMDLVICLFF